MHKKIVNNNLNYVCEFRIKSPSEDLAFEFFSSISDKFYLQKRNNSGSILVKFHLENLKDAFLIKQSIRKQISLLEELGIKILKSRIFELKEEDWTEKWKKFFKLQKVGKKLVIKPSWINYKAKKDEILIEIDPGMSFGTGKHETTRFCLIEIERLRGKGEKSFLDAGTGSGILSIAAEKLGYSHITAFDNDIEAINTAKENFEKNSIPIGKIELLLLKLEEAQKIRRRFDVIAANIISSELIKNSKVFKEISSPSGKIILAGIPDFDAKSVINAFNNFKVISKKSRYGWTGLTLSAI